MQKTTTSMLHMNLNTNYQLFAPKDVCLYAHTSRQIHTPNLKESRSFISSVFDNCFEMTNREVNFTRENIVHLCSELSMFCMLNTLL